MSGFGVGKLPMIYQLGSSETKLDEPINTQPSGDDPIVADNLLVSWFWCVTITSLRWIGARQTATSQVIEDRHEARVAAPLPNRARTVSVVGCQGLCQIEE